MKKHFNLEPVDHLSEGYEILSIAFAVFLVGGFLGSFALLGSGIGGIQRETQNQIQQARYKYPEGTLVYIKPDSQVVTIRNYDVTGELENRPEYKNVLWYYVMDENRKVFRVKEWEIIGKKNLHAPAPKSETK